MHSERTPFMKKYSSRVTLCLLIISIISMSGMAQHLFASQNTLISHPVLTHPNTTTMDYMDARTDENVLPRPPLTLYPLQDAYIDQETPYTNSHIYPLYIFLRVRSLEAKNQRSLVQFDTRSSIPYGAQISEAQLQVWLNFAPLQSRVFDLYRVTGAWHDTQVTWNNQPSHATETSGLVMTGDERKWLEWDVTRDTQGFLNGSFANYGWLFQDHMEDSTPPGFFCTLRALESPLVTYFPRLVIHFEEDTTSPSITLEKPKDNDTLYTPLLNITGWAMDNVGVICIGYHHDWLGGSEEKSWTLDYGYSRYRFEWPVMLHEGVNTITINATDMVGNQASYFFMVQHQEDTLAPQGQITRPVKGSLYISDRELVTGLPGAALVIGKITSVVLAVDNESGICQVDFLMDNELRHSDEESPFEWVIDDPLLGWHRLDVIVRDHAGNQDGDTQEIFLFNF